jgi:hypothetical protein
VTPLYRQISGPRRRPDQAVKYLQRFLS